MCGGVFQRTELLLYVFSIAITFHILKYTQRGIKGHWGGDKLIDAIATFWSNFGMKHFF